MKRTLAALLEARRAGRDVDDAENAGSAAVCAGDTRPDRLSDVVAGPVAPHVERRHDQLAAELAELHATHNQPRRHAATMLEGILGPRPSTAAVSDSWNHFAEILVDATCARNLAVGTRRDSAAGGTDVARRDELHLCVRVALDAVSAPAPEVVAGILAGQTLPVASRRRRQEVDIA